MEKKIVLSFLAVLLVLLPLSAGYAKPFYEGKTIVLVVATKPGGGFDLYGRWTARFMEKYLPGSTIIVRNIPGAGNIIGCNEIYHAKPNGLTFGIFNRALLVSQIVGLKGIKFDLAKMSWLGSCASGIRSLVVAKHTPYKSMDEAVKSEKTIKFASSGIGTADHLDALAISKMLGAKNWKIIPGYMGGEGELAMMRGEIDAAFMTWGTSGKPFVDAGEARVLMFTSDKPIKGYEDIPLLPNLAGEEYKALVDLMLFMVNFNRPFAGPPGIPADRLEILREAFKKSWHDPEMVARAEKLKVPINYIGGKEGERVIKSALQQPPQLIKLLKDAYGIKD